MRVELLDHGYLEFVESWGSDERIIEAARMSTAKGFLGWGPLHAPTCPYRSRESANGNASADCNCREDSPGDEKLLRFLWENKHATPFEMAGMTIEVQAPIFVFREWHRHRTQSYNEMSARYAPLPDTNYMATPERCLVVSGANRQAGVAKGAALLTHESALEWLASLAADVYAHCERVYVDGLVRGVLKEVARLPVPVGRYSRMRASANLRNWLAFLTLRMAPNAQYEIRQYANAVGEIIAEKFPRTWELFAAERASG